MGLTDVINELYIHGVDGIVSAPWAVALEKASTPWAVALNVLIFAWVFGTFWPKTGVLWVKIGEGVVRY